MRKQVVNKTHYRCLTPSLTSDKIEKYQKFLTERQIEENLNLLEVLSGEIRLKIIYLLASHTSLCVNDIADILKSKVSGISHQLSILKKARLVVSKKRQKTVFYSLNEKLPDLVLVTIKS